ncbi:CPBP family intramembrane glutamic endopeptidase [Actinoalloteichus sp. GBA129-24]|uniref:CPBP family intramembrane glutamic endopeptidase n=1 Tax=Actinoalloteichus sp. GBA129-24 TaxID=1612551 RepID=UPI0009503D07|nr:CPBP family intramembrane glutamic endopeptidase [Actinoalloteichus sp. GBA129-24]APU19773.1 putative metal-dependent membrane protease [Actinoalloteichus sp. GBA129-24]
MGEELPRSTDDPDDSPQAERAPDADDGPDDRAVPDGTPEPEATPGTASGADSGARGPSGAAVPGDGQDVSGETVVGTGQAGAGVSTPASGQQGMPHRAAADPAEDRPAPPGARPPGPTPMPTFSGGGPGAAQGWAPGHPVAVVPGTPPGAPSFTAPPPYQPTPVAQTYHAQPPGAPGHGMPGAGFGPPGGGVPAAGPPSWASYPRQMGGVQDGYDPRLHSRYWEAQLEASARSSLHWGFLAFFLGWGGYYLTGMLLSVVMAGRFENFDQLDPPPLGPLLLLSLLPNLFLGLGPAVLSWWKGSGLRRDFGILPKWRDVWVGLSCGGAGLLGAFIVALMVMGSAGESGDDSAISGMGALFEGQAVWVFCLALFMFIGAPLTEELLVRGALWGALEHFKVPRYAILLLTTFVFALIHEEPMRTPILLVGGLAMGIARMITGRVSAAIIAHATYNFLPALIFYTQFS